MDKIFLHHIIVDTFVGCDDWEQQQPTKVQIDLEIALPKAPGKPIEDIVQTVDYATVFSLLQKRLPAQHFKLIEQLSEDIAQWILGTFHVPWVKLTLTKLGVFADQGQVGIIIERSKSL